MRLKSTFRQTLLGVLVLGVSCPFVSAGGASSESVLVFQVRWGVAGQTGLALANPTDRVANVELFLIQNNGTFRGLAEVVIAAGEQQAKVLTDFFPTATNINGFIVAFSDNIGVVGFFLTFAPDISQIDGAEASLAIILSRAVIVPELLTGQGESTELNVIVFASSDPAPRNFTLEFDLCGADGACRREVRLLPSGPVGVARFSTTVAELFGGPGPAGEAVFDQSYVTVNVPNGLTIGYQEFRGENFRGGRDALSLLAGSSRPFSLFAAQVADTPDITSDITLINPTTLSATLNVSAFRTGVSDGNAEAMAPVVLPPGGVVKGNIRDLIELPAGDFVGWLRVDSDVSNVVGNVTFGDEARTFLSSVQMQGTALTEIVYSHLADGLGFFTGLTFLNVTPDPTDVEVEVFNPGGDMTGSGSFQLAGFEHGPRLLSQIIPGFEPQVGGVIRLSASQGIFSFEQFGFLQNNALVSLSAVPPQRGAGTVSGRVVPAAGQGAVEFPGAQAIRTHQLQGRFPASRAKGVRLDPEARFRPGEAIVRFNAATTLEGMASVAERMSLQIRSRAPGGVCLVRLDEGTIALQRSGRRVALQKTTLEMVEALNSRDDVVYAQPNHLFQIEGANTPNDTLFRFMWHFNNVFIPEAWEITTGSPAIVVAVIDSGAKTDHPDLGPRLTAGQADMIDDPQNSLDGDGRDFDADDPGDDPEGTNSSYHGTHVAGTIGAVTNNNLGVAGVNQVSPLMIVRTQGAEGVGTEFEIYNGLLFAVGLPNVLGEQPAGDFVAARVVNMSLGGTGIGPFGRQAVEDALGTGAIIVSSAGNSNSDAPHFPSDLPGVIEVGATDVLGDKTPYSNFGNNDIAAPGGNLAADINGDNRPDGVISTLWNQVQETPTYQFYQGTSMASAHVSGFVSLMLSANPDLTREQVMIILGLTSTVPAGAAQSPTGGLDPFYGVGIINAFQAVATAADVETGPRMVWTPGTLDFGVLHDELQARVFNLGSGDLSVEEPVVETTSGGSWMSAELEGEDLTVRVDRTGLADGRYEGTIQLMSNGGDGALDIGMQVGIDESSDIGDVFVLAIDPRTLNAEGQSEPARVSDGYQYEIYPFPAGEYLILAGTDRDDDGFICDEGEFCGSFPVSSQTLPVKVEAGLDTSGIDFTVAVEEEITPSSAAGRRGYRVRSTPALRKLLQRLRANGPAAWEAQSESDASGKTGEGK